MNSSRIIKAAALTGVLALGLLLTGCYIPPDEITNNTQNMNNGSGNLPFATVAPTATATPTPTPTEQPVVAITPVPATQQPSVTASWTDGWSGTATATPPPAGVITVTNTAQPAQTTRAAAATPTPTSTSTSLKKGAKGTRVKQVQQRLKDLGYYSGSVDGSYGDGTESAVKAFQSANGLRADGVVGTQTMTKLYSNSAKPYSAASSGRTSGKATSKPTAKATSKATKTPRPTATPNLSRATYLQIGSSGKKVRTLQNRLIELGWLAGKADGEYGGATQAAVKAFQKKTSGLWDDGIAGPDTQKALYSSGAAKSSSVVASTGESLRPGAEGGAVRALQTRLKKLGYYKGSVDGSYGTNTQEAVIAFQRNNGLTDDGIAGPVTLNKLYADDAVSATGSVGSSQTNGTGTASAAAGAVSGYTTLRPGDTGEAVTRLQTRLHALEFYDGNADGKYGSGTEAAVIAFQRQKGIRADGVAGPATQRLLYGTATVGKFETLREGDAGVDVAGLQTVLYELGYFDAAIDGVYGSTTADAVREFQLANHLQPVDGVAGNKTLQTLYSVDAVGAAAPNTIYATVRSGDTGDSVVELQDVLRQLGYLDHVTGVYDKDTEAAVKAFQQNNGLKADGVAGSATQTRLYETGPVPAY